MYKREDYTRVLQKIADACGASPILAFYLTRLQHVVSLAQQNLSLTANWATIEAILTAIQAIIPHFLP